jgi:G2/mitotic-specific cyclin 3/4
LSEKPAKNPRHYKSQPLLKAEHTMARSTHTRYLNRQEKLVEIEDDDVTEAAYEDAVEQLSQHHAAPAPLDLDEADELIHDGRYHADPDPEPYAAPVREVSRFSKALPAPPPSQTLATSELEEYWDDDDEQDLYDEQGYTTAHSYRSHGDNTTGGATTMVAPKVTANVQKELEMAKSIVLQNQTEEELEEEAWDVSMVAEYGEEIFEYMRGLEVSACSSLLSQGSRLTPSLVADASQPALYGHSNRNPMVDALGPDGLARPSSSSVHSPSRNVVLDCQLH